MSISVILLEDEYWVMQSLKRLCSSIPEVNLIGKFENAEQALAFGCKTHIDAAIIDILLPENSGFEVGKTLKLKNPELNLIYISADDAFEAQIQKYGGDFFIHKPVSKEVLLFALTQNFIVSG